MWIWQFKEWGTLQGFNPPEFDGSKVGKDPKVFIDEVYKVLMIMVVTSVEKSGVCILSLEMCGSNMV